MAKEDEETGDEEAPVSGEEAAEEELTPDEASSLLIDAEVFIRAGAERIDQLAAAGYLDASVQKHVDAVWNVLLAKIETEES